MNKSQDFLKYISAKCLYFLLYPFMRYPFYCYQQDSFTLSVQKQHKFNVDKDVPIKLTLL